MKISEAYETYINEFMYLVGRSKGQMEHFEQHKRYLVEFLGDKDIAELTLEDIAEFKKWLSLKRSNNTVRNYIGSLRTVLAYCRKKGVDCLSFEMIPVPKREQVVVPFVTAEEVEKMINTAQSLRTKFIISFLYASGLRISEFLSVDINQIINRQFTVVGKGNKERLCFIDRRTEKLMNDYLATRSDTCPALVVSRYGQRPSVSTVQRLVRETAERSGIKKRVTPHTFRHGAATNMIQNGADIRYVAQILGHSQLSTTMIYTHLVNPDLRAKYEQFHTI